MTKLMKEVQVFKNEEGKKFIYKMEAVTVICDVLMQKGKSQTDAQKIAKTQIKINEVTPKQVGVTGTTSKLVPAEKMLAQGFISEQIEKEVIREVIKVKELEECTAIQKLIKLADKLEETEKTKKIESDNEKETKKELERTKKELKELKGKVKEKFQEKKEEVKEKEKEIEELKKKIEEIKKENIKIKEELEEIKTREYVNPLDDLFSSSTKTMEEALTYENFRGHIFDDYAIKYINNEIEFTEKTVKKYYFEKAKLMHPDTGIESFKHESWFTSLRFEYEKMLELVRSTEKVDEDLVRWFDYSGSDLMDLAEKYIITNDIVAKNYYGGDFYETDIKSKYGK